jgi:hypothetical protein
MGIEYQIRSDSFDLAKGVELMPKVTSASNARVDVHENTWEFRFSDREGMPDVVLALQSDGAYVLYNGGTMRSWSVVGLFVATCAEWFGPISIEEL